MYFSQKKHQSIIQSQLKRFVQHVKISAPKHSFEMKIHTSKFVTRHQESLTAMLCHVLPPKKTDFPTQSEIPWTSSRVVNSGLPTPIANSNLIHAESRELKDTFSCSAAATTFSKSSFSQSSMETGGLVKDASFSSPTSTWAGKSGLTGDNAAKSVPC